jgi:hypothetical protein
VKHLSIYQLTLSHFQEDEKKRKQVEDEKKKKVFTLLNSISFFFPSFFDHPFDPVLFFFRLRYRFLIYISNELFILGRGREKTPIRRKKETRTLQIVFLLIFSLRMTSLCSECHSKFVI